MYVSLQRKQGECQIAVEFEGNAAGITALCGPSGAGKTSVAMMVAGLTRPDRGVISVGGRCLFDAVNHINVPTEKRSIGYVFQDGRLFPHLSVKGNLLYGSQRSRAGRAVTSLEQVAHLLGIDLLLHRKPKTLSGGEKQRVALGRALLSSPRLLIMDEPLASLDSARKEELLPFIKRLNHQFQIPILYVTHSQREIDALADTIVTLKDGRIRPL